MDAAACIGCGACVAACPNASAMLFTRPRSRTSACCRRASPSATRARSSMVAQMDAEGFGDCTNHGECEAVCPKEISIDVHRPDEPRLPAGDLDRPPPEQPPRGLVRSSGPRVVLRCVPLERSEALAE